MYNKKSILIAVENKLLSGAIQGLMEEYGHIVSCCYHGLEAIKLSEERDFDMFLIDYDMPEIKGDLVCALIRHHHPDGYIVGISGEFKEQIFINAGANKFIYKGDLAQNFSLLHQIVQMTP
jgi:CheY-like chemotaxis protein